MPNGAPPEGGFEIKARPPASRQFAYGRENQLRDKLTWAPPAWLHAKRFKHDPREHNICPGTEAPASCHHSFAKTPGVGDTSKSLACGVNNLQTLRSRRRCNLVNATVREL